MYFSLGSNKVKTNFIDLYCRSYALADLTKDNCFNKIKSSYINIISNYIPIELTGIGEDVPFLRVNDGERCIKLCEEYNLSRLDDLSQTDIIKNSTYDVSDRAMMQYLEALDYIKNQSKDLYEVFSLVINVIFLCALKKQVAEVHQACQVLFGSIQKLTGVLRIEQSF